MRVYVIVHIWSDLEDHYDFIDVLIKEVDAYKTCNALNQQKDVGYYEVVVKDFDLHQ